MTNTNKKVMAAMSGGVDSSVAAALLIEQGFDVFGATMIIHASSDEKHIRDAAKVAERLGIEHHVIDLSIQFEKTIISNFIDEYRSGRTPNPCVVCNPTIKFGAFMDRAIELGAEHFATGHYARIERDTNKGRMLLKKGLDPAKDQSYALYRLTQEQLSRTIFPLGGVTKERTRAIAASLGLEVADKSESQDICFVENRDYQAFLKKTVPDILVPGPIYDTGGKLIGQHEGIALYTVGQRKRIGVSTGIPLYIVKIDAEKNAIIMGGSEELYEKHLTAENTTYISIENPSSPFAAEAKIRYNIKESEALITPIECNKALVEFKEAQRAVTPGQSVVFYDEDTVIGGGTIKTAT